MRASTGTSGNGLIKRSVQLHGHATSVALEQDFWDALAKWAEGEGMSLAALISALDRQRAGGSLASALRVAVLRWALGRAQGG
jgi:predicted DNA-binding ribbon-helix-helix protein